jgi:cbb3-type cytochrome oxidase subunit 3
MAKITSRRGMSVAEGAFHAFMIICTCGVWYPVYRARKHQADRTTVTVL